MKKLTFKIGIVLSFAIAITSCEKENLILTNDTEIQEESIIAESGEGLIVLGKQLEDPYSLKNMEQAYANLKSANPKIPDHKINPTHMYMRFLPADNDEWDLLKKDTTLILFDFPLDYEIKNLGTYYHDPSLPEDAITWQYCVLPIGYNIPDIQNELIYEVYIPGKDKNYKGMDQFLNDLEYESVKLTGNLPKEGLSNTKGKWTPEGTIKVWDDLIGSTTTSYRVFDHWEYYDCGGDDHIEHERNQIIVPIEQCKRAVYRYVYTAVDGSYIPLAGAKVSARWFTHVATGITNSSGNFRMGSFRYKVNYAIKWERGDYDIRNGTLLQAWYNGPKQKGDWDLNIGKGGKSIMYATIHRAAYKQFYGDNLGIRKPTGLGKTKLCYIDENGTGIFWGDWIDYGILPDIKIWGKKDGSYRTVNQIFGTTTHELGHMSHWHLIGVDNYAFTGEVIYESWATAVEWALTNDEYHTMGARFGGTAAINYNHEDGKGRWPVGVTWEYSPIFIDLIDDVNQRTIWGSNRPNDLIDGYSLQYIQNKILKDARGISSLHTAVKANKIPGVSDADIDELFALYW